MLRGTGTRTRVWWMPPLCAPMSMQRGLKKAADEPPEIRAEAEALGYSPGGFSTKVHLRAEC
jgi:hypothetical protein